MSETGNSGTSFSRIKEFVDNRFGTIVFTTSIIFLISDVLSVLFDSYGVYKRDPVLAAGVHVLAVIIPILIVYGCKKTFPDAERSPIQIEATAEVPDV